MSDISCVAPHVWMEVAPIHRALQTRWPTFHVPLPEFAEYLRERQLLPGEGATSPHAADLYLVCACLRGVSPALKVLEKEYLDPVLEPAKHDPQRADLRQIVLERLLVHPRNQLPKLADYSGRASLRTWLRVVARHTQLNWKRRQLPARQIDPAEYAAQYLIPTGSDPEFEYMRIRYSTEFRRAFRTSLARLDARSRVLVKLRMVEGTTGEDMATLFGVNRATIVRWLADARQALLMQTRAALEKELQLSRAEFDSVVRLLGSALDVSLSLLDWGGMSDDGTNQILREFAALSRAQQV